MCICKCVYACVCVLVIAVHVRRAFHVQCSRANATQLAIALPREVLEIEVPDTSFLESNLPHGDSQPASGTTSPKRRYVCVYSLLYPPRPSLFAHTHTSKTRVLG